MPPASINAGRRPLCFTAVVSIFFLSFFSPPNLRGRLADRHQTLSHGRWYPGLWNSVRHLEAPSPRNSATQKHHISISDNFATWSRMSPERHKISSIGKRHCKLRTLRTGKIDSVNYGPQTAKNNTGVLNHPPAIVQRTGVNKSVEFARGQHAYLTGGHHAGHWHASSIHYISVWFSSSTFNPFTAIGCKKLPYRFCIIKLEIRSVNRTNGRYFWQPSERPVCFFISLLPFLVNLRLSKQHPFARAVETGRSNG